MFKKEGYKIQLVSNTEDNGKIIEITAKEYDDLMRILDVSILPDHRKNLYTIKSKMWNDLYDMDLDI